MIVILHAIFFPHSLFVALVLIHLHLIYYLKYLVCSIIIIINCLRFCQLFIQLIGIHHEEALIAIFVIDFMLFIRNRDLTTLLLFLDIL